MFCSYEKKREGDRLKCNVCGENFRERHHLTRHMTAHQDRAEDQKRKSAAGAASQQSENSDPKLLPALLLSSKSAASSNID